MDWDKLRIFRSVADAGSFTSAGNALNLSQSAISRQIIGLEGQLKISLFHRHARGLILTEQGRILYRSVQEVSQKLETVQTRLKENQDKPSGILTVNVRADLGSMWVAPLLREFHERYPDVEVHLICSEKKLDVSMLETDMAVLQHPSTSQGLIQKKLMHMCVYAYGSNEYLERRGTPKTAKDLNKHDIIGHDSAGVEVDKDWNVDWLLGLGADAHAQRRPVMCINNLHGMYRAVRMGMGIAALPEFMEGLPGGLQKVLPEERSPEYDVYVVYPEEYRNTAKVQAFKDFLVEKSQTKR